MQVIAEIGSCWLPGEFPLEDAIDAALDCGADLVKLQFFACGAMLARRRGGAKGLEAWQLAPRYVADLAERLFEQHKRPVLGVSVFDPDDVHRLANAQFSSKKVPLAFIKTATQEYQYALLAEAVSSFSTWQGVPLYVSVPPDGCLVVGNYHSSQPITWLQCEPHYPADDYIYDPHRVLDMSKRLPGAVGVSDHRSDDQLAKTWAKGCNFTFSDARTDRVWSERAEIAVIEKHFLYDEKLRGKVPDGGPWSLSRKDFKKYVEIAHGNRKGD